MQLLAGYTGSANPRRLLDQRADIFHPPCRNSAPKFNGLGEAAGLYARPPRRLADRDRPAGCKDRSQPQETRNGCFKLTGQTTLRPVKDGNVLDGMGKEVAEFGQTETEFGFG